MQILVVDDDRALCRSLQIHLERAGNEVRSIYTGSEALELIAGNRPELVFLDIQLPDVNGLDVLREIHSLRPDCLVTMITGTQDSKATIEAVRAGAFDYIRKPLDLDAILVTVEKANQHFRRIRDGELQLSSSSRDPHEIVGSDSKTIEMIKEIGLLSQSNIPVLILGESGSGKELVAYNLHSAADSESPFVAINCSAIVPTLLESELFGHERGAFTGAVEKKLGKLEVAREGTVFLDEIGDMPLELQAKLLRALETKRFERVGGTASIEFRARVVAATHRDLKVLVENGEFREDLYYRLAVSSIRVPPLRERKSDVPLLVNSLLTEISRELEKPVSGLEQNALLILQQQNWPGNVRELKNVLMRTLITARDGFITADVVQTCLERPADEAETPRPLMTLKEIEKEHIERTLSSVGWNITKSAAILGITRVTLRKKIEDYGIRPPGA